MIHNTIGRMIYLQRHRERERERDSTNTETATCGLKIISQKVILTKNKAPRSIRSANRDGLSYIPRITGEGKGVIYPPKSLKVPIISQ